MLKIPYLAIPLKQASDRDKRSTSGKTLNRYSPIIAKILFFSFKSATVENRCCVLLLVLIDWRQFPIFKKCQAIDFVSLLNENTIIVCYITEATCHLPAMSKVLPSFRESPTGRLMRQDPVVHLSPNKQGHVSSSSIFIQDVLIKVIER